MAEHIVKLIPCLHTYRTNARAAEATVAALKKAVPAEEITFLQTDRPEFVDCGNALEEISCPRCGAAVDMEWWSEKMDEMYRSDHFLVLEQEMPCCGKSVSFDRLRYRARCGFSSLCFLIREPKDAVGKEAEELLGERFGISFRRVDAWV